MNPKIKKMLDNRMKDSVFKYFDVSAKSNYNFDKPFLELLKKITGKNGVPLLI